MKDLLTEIKKEYKKNITKKNIVALLLVSCFLSLYFCLTTDLGYTENWREEISAKIIMNNSTIETISELFGEDNDMVVSLHQENRLYQYRLDNNLYPETGAYIFLYDTLKGFNSVLAVITGIVSVSVICNEYKFKTIVPLVTRPERRRRTIIAKTAICWLAVIVFVFLSSFLLIVFFQLFNHTAISKTILGFDFEGHIVERNVFLILLKNMLVVIEYSSICLLLAVFLSLLLKRASTVGIVLFVFIAFGSRILSVFRIPDEVEFAILPCTLSFLSDVIGTPIDFGQIKTIQYCFAAFGYCLVFFVLVFLLYTYKPYKER